MLRRNSISITLNVIRTGGSFVFEISDNGVGFDVSQLTHRGSGFKLVEKLISFYNSENELPYYIAFETNQKYIRSTILEGTKIHFTLNKKGT